MPDYFSHIIAAEKVYEKLDVADKEKIQNKILYLLGSQGADVFFTYSYKFSKNNLGRELHQRKASSIFEALKNGDLSYAAGYATHYALDCSLHPAVYAYTKGRKNPLTHQRFENDLGLFISKFYGIPRRILPREHLLSCTSAVYDSVKLLQPEITITGVERCLKRHFNYTRYLYRAKEQNYKCDFDFTSLADSVRDAIDLGATAVKCILSKNIDGVIFSKEFLQR